MPKKKNLQEEDIKDIVAEDAEATEKAEEKKDEVWEEVKEEPKEETPESHEDVEALKLEIAALKDEVSTQSEKMTKDMVSKLATTFGITKEEEVKDQTPWDKEGRQPTWTEALEYMGEKTHAKIKAEMEAEDQKEQQEAEKQTKTQEDFNKNINTYWDKQIDELVKAGRIPAVQDEKNEKDEGKLFRVELFKTMMDVNQKRQEQGLDAISNLKEIFYEHFKAPNQQPAGYDAPIAGAVRTNASASVEKIPYGQFHGQSIEDIVGNS